MWWYQNNLKIEFRAVPYAASHVLEYRISPDQDLNFEIEKSFFGIKYKKKKKYKTNWHQPLIFVNYPGASHNNEKDCYLPIFIRTKNDLENFKFKFKNIGEFFNWKNEENKKEKDKWIIAHNNYLEQYKDWY